MARSGRPSFAKTMANRAVMTWLMVLALFVQVLTPLSAALALEVGGSDQLVICTATGFTTVNVDADGQPVAPKDDVSCPFCMTHAAPAIFSPDAANVSALILSNESAIPLRTQDTLLTSVWGNGPNPSRAPPLSV